MRIGFDVAALVGPDDRHQHQRRFLQAPQSVVCAPPQRRLVRARHGDRRLQIGTDELGLAERAIDRLEGQRGVLRQDLGIVAGGLCGEIDLGAITGVQVGNEDGRDRNGKEIHLFFRFRRVIE